MKRFLSICTAGIVFLAGGAFATPGYAQAKDNVTVIVDGAPMTVVGHPAVLDETKGRVMIPFKSLFLAIGVAEKDIKWNTATSTAKGTREGIEVELTKNSTTAKVNGKSVEMDAPPVIMGTSMMVPLSFVASQMGGETKWEGNPAYKVNISMGNGLFPFEPAVPVNPTTPVEPETPVNPTNPTNPTTPGSTAPAKDTAASNSEIHGTWAMQSVSKVKYAVQFRADKTMDIKNISSNKAAKGTYSISGDNVTIKSDVLSGTYKLEKTTYSGTVYYILNNTDSTKTLAITAVSYDEFASVY